MTGSILPLRVDGLIFEAGNRRLLDDISFVLEAGNRSVILGPNGAGKSLMLRLCHGLITPTAGRIAWGDGNIPPAYLTRRQAMVFQKPVMLRRSTAANISHALVCHGVTRRDRPARVAEALSRTGLEALARVPARVLSAGEQQRLALARAWILQPEVMFLDEPTASLDPASTRSVEDIILAIHRAGTKIVLTTQDLGQARRIADEILFLNRGRLVERTSANDFFAGPATPEARAFISGELITAEQTRV
jgi:tungstate transport system ATP-binding protein